MDDSEENKGYRPEDVVGVIIKSKMFDYDFI